MMADRLEDVVTYTPTLQNDLMQHYRGKPVGKLGLTTLSPDTADLFAASPEMLAVLEAMVDEIERNPTGTVSVGTLADAKAAIEKATVTERRSFGKRP